MEGLISCGVLVFLLALIMGLIVKLAIGRGASARPPSSPQPGNVASPGAGQLPSAMDGYGYLSVVGESQYQPALQQIAQRGRTHWAKLVPEPGNPFDSNAVMVEIDGQTVGYLSRGEARRYQRRLLPLAEPMQVPAKLIGGTDDKPSIGVLLDHREVEALATPKRTRTRKVEIPPDDQPF
jgi:hypothetical protein